MEIGMGYLSRHGVSLMETAALLVPDGLEIGNVERLGKPMHPGRILAFDIFFQLSVEESVGSVVWIEVMDIVIP